MKTGRKPPFDRAVMSTADMANLFGVTQQTVQKWCREGIIVNAEKPGGTWIVRGTPIKRYRPRKRKRYCARDRYIDILQACNRGELAYPRDLACSEADFIRYANLLVKQGLLDAKQEADHKGNTLGYLITLEGTEYLSGKKDLIDLLAKAISITASQVLAMP